jgi:DNA-binding NarL/FixJ family response regulator
VTDGRSREQIEAEIADLEARLGELRSQLAAAAEADGDYRLRVLIADDDGDIRALLSALIGSADDLELVASADDTQQAIDAARSHKPDVAVLDLSMPGGGGTLAAISIVRDSPQTKIVAFTSLDTMDAQLEVMRAGAVSFLVKGARPDEILKTIRQAPRW